MRIPATTTAATSYGNGNKRRRNNNIPVPVVVCCLQSSGLASTISCPCKLFVDNFVWYKSPRASVRTIQASPEANSSPRHSATVCLRPQSPSPIAVSVQQSVKERAVTIHKAQTAQGARDGPGRVGAGASFGPCSIAALMTATFEFDFALILAIKMHKICKVQRFKSILSAIKLHCGCSLGERLSSVNACKVSLRVARQSALISTNWTGDRGFWVRVDFLCSVPLPAARCCCLPAD